MATVVFRPPRVDAAAVTSPLTMLRLLSLAFLCRGDTLSWGEFPRSQPSLLAVALPGYPDFLTAAADPQTSAIVAVRRSSLDGGAWGNSEEQWIGDG